MNTFDICQMRSHIKHAPETVDLEEVRSLLGGVDAALDALYLLRYPDTMNMSRTSGDKTFLTLKYRFADEDQTSDLIAWLSGVDL